MEQLRLDPNEAVTVYKALEIAHSALSEGLKDESVCSAFTPEQLASHEELCLKFADLLERFKGLMP